MVVSLTYREGHIEGEVFLAVSVARFILVHFRNGPAMFLGWFSMLGPKKAAFEKLLGGPRGELLVQLSKGCKWQAHRTFQPILMANEQ